MNGFWQSVLNSKKAIIAGVIGVIGVLIAATEASPTHTLTWTDALVAAGTYLVAHVGTYGLSNDNQVQVKDLLAALASQPTVERALAGLGIALPPGLAALTPAPAGPSMPSTSPAPAVLRPSPVQTPVVRAPLVELPAATPPALPPPLELSNGAPDDVAGAGAGALLDPDPIAEYDIEAALAG